MLEYICNQDGLSFPIGIETPLFGGNLLYNEVSEAVLTFHLELDLASQVLLYIVMTSHPHLLKLQSYPTYDMGQPMFASVR